MELDRAVDIQQLKEGEEGGEARAMMMVVVFAMMPLR